MSEGHLTKVEAAVEVHIVEKRVTNICLDHIKVENKERYDGKRPLENILHSPACPRCKTVSHTHPRLRVPEFLAKANKAVRLSC